MNKGFKIINKSNKEYYDDEIFIGSDGRVYLIEEREWAYQSYMYKEDVSDEVEIIWL